MALAEDCHERGVKIGTQMLCSLFLVPECDLESENVIVHRQKARGAFGLLSSFHVRILQAQNGSEE